MSDDGHGRDAVGIELRGAELHAHGSRKSADNCCLRYVRDLLEVVLHLRRDGSKLIAVVVLAPQRESKNRNVVDRTRLNERLRDSRWHPIEVRVELAIDLDKRIFLGRADQKADDHQALSGA